MRKLRICLCFSESGRERRKLRMALAAGGAGVAGRIVAGGGVAGGMGGGTVTGTGLMQSRPASTQRLQTPVGEAGSFGVQRTLCVRQGTQQREGFGGIGVRLDGVPADMVIVFC